jgi:hypothetical protein
LAEESNNSKYLTASIRKLFEDIAIMVDNETNMVETHYGNGSMFYIIQKLHREADIETTILLHKYIEMNKINELVAKITDETLKGQKGSTVLLDVSIDARELDMILTDLTAICDQANLFIRFMASRSLQQIKRQEKIEDNEKTKMIANMDKLRKTNHNIQKIINYIVVFGEFYVKKSIQKAFKIDHKEEGELNSSVVDDVFYIIKTCIQRGLSTRDPDCFCALINSIANTVELDYMDKLQSKLSTLFLNEKDDLITHITPTINNIDTSCEYIQRLCQDVVLELENIFNNCTDMEIEQIKASLSTMTDYASKYGSILKVLSN